MCNAFRKMSFEFNPNKNLDRSEEDNDPQDYDCLGGEREDPLAEESLVYPKWLEHATTKTM